MALRRHTAMKTIPALLAGFLLHGVPVFAQQSSLQGRDKTVKKQLADSEAKVQILQQRIERLERRLDALASSSARPVPVAGLAAPQPGQGSGRVSPPTSPVAAGSRPGNFDVDEDAAQRALERTLTQSGALLLPQGAISVTPGIAYTRNEQSTGLLANVVNPVTGVTGVVLGNQTVRRNEFTARVDMRAGLPMQSQLEIGVPYQYVRSSRIDSFGGEASANGNGFGDISIGLAKTLMREKGAFPDLIGRVSYVAGTGRRTDNQVALGGGYHQLVGEIVALKRQDPLAFFAAASYGYVFERDGLKPGNATNLSIGTVLAASPATSLQLGFTQTYRQKSEAGGAKLTGTDLTYGTINLGASSVLSRDMMLLISTGIGVGSDAPKYSFSVSLPITFR